jgi:hypothetical protein
MREIFGLQEAWRKLHDGVKENSLRKDEINLSKPVTA